MSLMSFLNQLVCFDIFSTMKPALFIFSISYPLTIYEKIQDSCINISKNYQIPSIFLTT